MGGAQNAADAGPGGSLGDAREEASSRWRNLRAQLGSGSALDQSLRSGPSQSALGYIDDDYNFPAALLRLDAEVVRQDALWPYTRVMTVHRELTHGLASEVFWFSDTAVDIDIDCRMPETTVRKHWYRKERRIIKIHGSQEIRHAK